MGIAVPTIMLSSIASIIAIMSASSTTRTLRCFRPSWAFSTVSAIFLLPTPPGGHLLAARLVTTLGKVDGN
ncbi:hypothetical protein SGPA1_60282 [Streptomyces misionensis JCM 4497]